MAKIASALDTVPLRNLKRELTSGEAARQKVTLRGALIDLARKRCGLEVKTMAADMGVSESFLLRGFKDQEHISWQRLARLPDVFHRKFIAVQAEHTAGVELDINIRIRRA